MNYEELDPGVRDFVRELNNANITTTDSGDGRSKHPSDRTMAGAHIVAVCHVEEIDEVMHKICEMAQASDEWCYDFAVTCSYELYGEQACITLAEETPEVAEAVMNGVTYLASENDTSDLAQAREEAEHALTVLFCLCHYNLQDSCPPWLTVKEWRVKLGLGVDND